ncbi:hypothetical protein EEL33_01105 [Muribaculaceae bacterium Isolate-037 (Harlan)]|nr:hypothetical protein EEL33_01105 [Muribaculaceae bacterium Isolate-037 (Harlan)]
MADVSKTDLKRLVKYLDDAAELYARQSGQKYESRRYYLKLYSRKLQDKLNKFHNAQTPIGK